MVNSLGSKLVFSVFLVLLMALSVSAVDCWDYNADESGCETAGCVFEDDGGNTWCNEKSCWNLYDQSSCTSANITGESCSWTSGGEYSYCGDVSCWSYSGENESFCESNSAGLSAILVLLVIQQEVVVRIVGV